MKESLLFAYPANVTYSSSALWLFIPSAKKAKYSTMAGIMNEWYILRQCIVADVGRTCNVVCLYTRVRNQELVHHYLIEVL